MKKAGLILTCVLFALLLLLPLGLVLCACFGYVFELGSYTATAIVTAAVDLSAAVAATKGRGFGDSRVCHVLAVLSAPLSLVTAVVCMVRQASVPVAAGMTVSVICSCYLAARYGKPLALKITGLALAGVMVMPVCYVSFLLLIFGNIGVNRVVQTACSPDQTYCAQVIDSDQGALGGDTLVKVCETGGVNVLIFKISKQPQTVYRGEWGEFEDMELYWKDNQCLVIDGREYVISE